MLKLLAPPPFGEVGPPFPLVMSLIDVVQRIASQQLPVRSCVWQAYSSPEGRAIERRQAYNRRQPTITSFCEKCELRTAETLTKTNASILRHTCTNGSVSQRLCERSSLQSAVGACKLENFTYLGESITQQVGCMFVGQWRIVEDVTCSTTYGVRCKVKESIQCIAVQHQLIALHRYGKLTFHMGSYTLPATRQRLESRFTSSLSRYSIQRPRRWCRFYRNKYSRCNRNSDEHTSVWISTTRLTNKSISCR